MHPAPIIAIWIALSSSVILFNAVSFREPLLSPQPYLRELLAYRFLLLLLFAVDSVSFYLVPESEGISKLTRSLIAQQRKRRRRFKLPLPYYSHDFPSSLRSHRYEVDAKVYSAT